MGQVCLITFWQALSHDNTSSEVEQGPGAFEVERFYHTLHLSKQPKCQGEVLILRWTCAALAISIMNCGQESGDQENFAATSLATRWFAAILKIVEMQRRNEEVMRNLLVKAKGQRASSTTSSNW